MSGRVLYKADAKATAQLGAVREVFHGLLQKDNPFSVLTYAHALRRQRAPQVVGKKQKPVALPPLIDVCDFVQDPVHGGLTLGYNHLSRITASGTVDYIMLYFTVPPTVNKFCFTEMVIRTDIPTILAVQSVRDLNEFERKITLKALGGLYPGKG